MRRSALLVLALAVCLLVSPAFAQAPKGNTKGTVTPPAGKGPAADDKAPAAPRGVSVVQTGDVVKITWQGGAEDAAYNVHAMGGGVTKAIRKIVAAVGRQLVVTLQELAQIFGTTVQALAGNQFSFFVEAINAKGRVSPKAAAPIVLKGPAEAPADSTPTPTTPTTSTPKSSTAANKGWAAQTSRSEVTLAWTPDKSATSQRIVFEFGGQRFILGTFVPAVARAVYPLPRLSRLVGQRLDGLQGSPLIFRLESLVGQRVAGIFDFNRVVPVSPAKALASKQAPAGVKAEQTGPGEITVTWEANPDAVAYAIGRAQGNEGFKMICALCSTEEARFVDTTALTGTRHVYTVQAVTVDGMGARATSNTVGEPAPKAATQ